MGNAWATGPINALTDEQQTQMQRAATDLTSSFADLPDWAQAAIIAGEAEKRGTPTVMSSAGPTSG